MTTPPKHLNPIPRSQLRHHLIQLTPHPNQLPPHPNQLPPQPRTHHPLSPHHILKPTNLTLSPHRHRRQIISPNGLHQTHRTRQPPRNIRRRQPRRRQPRHQPRTIRPRQLRRTPPRPRRPQHRRHQLHIRNPPRNTRRTLILNSGHHPQNTTTHKPTRRPKVQPSADTPPQPPQPSHRTTTSTRHTRKPHHPTRTRHQHIMRNHQRGKAVRLMLTRLPPHRALLKLRQIPSHTNHPHLQPLQQRRRPRHRIPHPRPPLRRPRRHLDRPAKLRPRQRLTHHPHIRLPSGETLHHNLRRTHPNRQLHRTPRPLIRRHRSTNIRDHRNHTLRRQRRRHHPTRITTTRIRRIHPHHRPNRRLRRNRQPPTLQPTPLHQPTLRRRRHTLKQRPPRPLPHLPTQRQIMLSRKTQRRHHRHTRHPPQSIRNTSRSHRRHIRMPPPIRLPSQKLTTEVTLHPPSLNQTDRPARMHTRRQRRPELIQNPATMRRRIRLSLILQRVVNEQQRRPMARDSRVNTRRQQPAVTALHRPPAHRRLIRRQTKPQELVMLLNDPPRLTAVLLGQIVGIGHQDDRQVRVHHQRPDHGPDHQLRLTGTRRGVDDVPSIRLRHRPHRHIRQQPDRRRHPKRRVQPPRQLSRRPRPTQPPRRRDRTHTHQHPHRIHQASVTAPGDQPQTRETPRRKPNSPQVKLLPTLRRPVPPSTGRTTSPAPRRSPTR